MSSAAITNQYLVQFKSKSSLKLIIGLSKFYYFKHTPCWAVTWPREHFRNLRLSAIDFCPIRVQKYSHPYPISITDQVQNLNPYWPFICLLSKTITNRFLAQFKSRNSHPFRPDTNFKIDPNLPLIGPLSDQGSIKLVYQRQHDYMICKKVTLLSYWNSKVWCMKTAYRSVKINSKNEVNWNNSL